ncbi:MAG: ABC transporter ATP-binding protein [Gemmatimonadota bacterium]
MQPAAPAIEVAGLVKHYGDTRAVDGISLRVETGEVFGLLGPNGAGKTSTLRMIAGILRPDEGRVLIDGFDVVTDAYGAKARLGYIPDRPFVYEKLTGAELLRFVAGLYGQSGEEVEERIRELLSLWDLEGWADELVEAYSHGMRQKLIISSALVHRPRALVIDEPMVGLDPRAARLLKDLLRAFAHTGGTALLSTHTLEFAEVLCERMAVIDHGRIVAQGTMAELREHAAAHESGLEEIFLRLTGGVTERELMRVLAG